MARPASRKEIEEPFQILSIPRGSTIEGEWKVRPPESAAERRHRLRKDAWSFWVKEASTYIVALLVMVSTTVYCLWALFQPGLSREDRQWVMSVLGSLLVGIVGYVFGKATK
jgi:hypothetical protein